ncbi:MAG: HAD-IIA family hydrolase [Nitrososphaeria archaeon]
MFEGIRGIFIDLDGCMYRGNTAIPKVDKSIAILKERGYRLLYVTNNASRTQKDYVEHFARMGLSSEEKEFYTSAMATSTYMLQKYGPGRRVFVVGTNALKSELQSKGFIILTEDEAKVAEFVVLCLDLETTYRRLTAACYSIQNGAKFIATNLDMVLPVEDGYWLGAGALASAITAATGVKPFLIGKPSKVIIQMALKYAGLKKDEVLLVGDKFETDIRVANRLKMKSALVLTGVTKAEQLAKIPEKFHPNVILESVNGLPDVLP